jgi:hypothetical protein
MPSVLIAVWSCILPGLMTPESGRRPRWSLNVVLLMVFCFFLPEMNALQPGRPARTPTHAPPCAMTAPARTRPTPPLHHGGLMASGTWPSRFATLPRSVGLTFGRKWTVGRLKPTGRVGEPGGGRSDVLSRSAQTRKDPMAEKDRPAWFGWVADRAGRYLWRPRHSRDEGSQGVSWMAIVVVAAVILGIGAAAYAGFRIDDDERPPADVALPGPSLLLPGDYPSVAVSVAAAPSASAPSAPPSPSVAASERAARPPAGRSRPTEAVTTHPPAARMKTPVWEERVIASTSVLTTRRAGPPTGSGSR